MLQEDGDRNIRELVSAELPIPNRRELVAPARSLALT
jgi:hypothetical protein